MSPVKLYLSDVSKVPKYWIQLGMCHYCRLIWTNIILSFDWSNTDIGDVLPILISFENGKMTSDGLTLFAKSTIFQMPHICFKVSRYRKIWYETTLHQIHNLWK